VWPIRERGAAYDADTFLDVIEALHDLIAKPLDGWHHDFGGCGMHWHTFDRRAGADEFRAQLNPLLARYEMPLELSATGEVVALAPDEMRGLLDAPIPFFADHDLVTSRVETAIALYRSRNSTRIDRRHAVRELADVLESLRSEIKEEMLLKDERELFNLANGLAIRQLPGTSSEKWRAPRSLAKHQPGPSSTRSKGIPPGSNRSLPSPAVGSKAICRHRWEAMQKRPCHSERPE